MAKKQDLLEFMDTRLAEHPGNLISTSMTLYQDQITAVKAIADRRDVSTSEVFRILIDYALSQQPKTEVQP